MTKKDYELIASALASVVPRIEWLNKRQQWRYCCKALAMALHGVSRELPNGAKAFQKEKFLLACGVNRDEVSDLMI